MRKAPVDLKPGDLIVGQAKCLLKVVSTEADINGQTIGGRLVRTSFVSPFHVAEEVTLDGGAMVDVWDDTNDVDQ